MPNFSKVHFGPELKEESSGREQPEQEGQKSEQEEQE